MVDRYRRCKRVLVLREGDNRVKLCSKPATACAAALRPRIAEPHSAELEHRIRYRERAMASSHGQCLHRTRETSPPDGGENETVGPTTDPTQTLAVKLLPSLPAVTVVDPMD